MNRMLAFGLAAAVAIALLPQSFPGAEAAEKKVKAKGSNKAGVPGFGQEPRFIVTIQPVGGAKRRKGLKSP
jgi:hypothetical protein